MAEEDQSGAREGFAHVVLCPEIVRQIDARKLKRQGLKPPPISAHWGNIMP